jgi:predicted nucleotidyltransferase
MSVLADIPWAVTPQKVEAVVRRLIPAARPRKIILFGSYARGQVDRESDLDVLVVVEDNVVNPRAESVRLRDTVEDIDMAMDILVVPESRFEALHDVPGLIYREACEHGPIVYERSK